MKINPKILSVPPYISTSWKNIASLHVENQHTVLILVVTLLSGARIEVPDLDPAMIEAIFAAHAQYMEQEEKQTQNKLTRPPINFPINQEQVLSMELPLKNGLLGFDPFGTLLQHNPDQANRADLPPDILEKITQLSKTMGIDDPNTAPKPEPHCNCMYCQIARALQTGIQGQEEEKAGMEEEIVTEEDLKFKTWDITRTSDKLYVVTNPLDTKEHYNVFLGEPVGCTCGEKHCEHIRAVLST